MWTVDLGPVVDDQFEDYIAILDNNGNDFISLDGKANQIIIDKETA